MRSRWARRLQLLGTEDFSSKRLGLAQVARQDISGIAGPLLRWACRAIQTVCGFPKRVALLRLAEVRQAGGAQVIRPIAAEKPATVLEVAFDEIITGRLASFVVVCLGAPGASGGETVLGGGSTGTGDLRLELTCDTGH
jgi:hypothetical protein